MKVNNNGILGAAIAGILLAPAAMAADTITEALNTGTAYGDFRLRYESVEQDNALKDASALTLRSRLGYTTGSISGLSATIELEDSRVVGGQDEYGGDFSVIADPETTELDQFFIQYKTDTTTSKIGRQVINLDGQRLVGGVGWRQDRQTFDAFTIHSKPTEKLSLYYAYIGQRNRIFAETGDLTSDDHLLNVSYQTSLGKLVGYGYFLDVDDGIDNARDTLGVSFSGAKKSDSVKFLYKAEYATQSYEDSGVDRDATYTLLEAGLQASYFTGKIGYEVLGSDEGNYGFTTELATLHKFNGWADQFLNTPAVGLVDTYFSAGFKLPVGKLSVIYHDFSADEGSLDLGKEVDVVYGLKFAKQYNAGIKYAAYSAGDAEANKVDTDKLWLWVGASF